MFDAFFNRMSAALLCQVSSSRARFGILAAAFVLLVILRQVMHSFGVSLGYLYVFLISLAGFWFGIVGGLAAAVVSSLTFLVEVALFPEWPGRALVMKGLPLRLAVYFLEGIILGLLCRLDRRLQGEIKMKEHLRTLAYRDELTGCLNYRWIMKRAGQEVLRASRYRKAMAVAILDIDHFKEVNDTHGHPNGNRVLKAFTGLVEANLRSIDVLGRYGGDEFLVVLPETGAEEARAVMDRIRTVASGTAVDLSNGNGPVHARITFSAGIAVYPANGLNGDELLFAADNALLQAKRDGRNRVVTERRRAVRLRPHPGIRMEMGELLEGDRTEALAVVNISKGGVLLLMPQAMPPGELWCRIIFGDGSRSSDFKCRVVRQEDAGGNAFSVGVSFVDVPDHLVDRLSGPETVLPAERWPASEIEEQFAAPRER